MADEMCFMCDHCAHVIADADTWSCSGTVSVIWGLITIEAVKIFKCLGRFSLRCACRVWHGEDREMSVSEPESHHPLITASQRFIDEHHSNNTTEGFQVSLTSQCGGLLPMDSPGLFSVEGA